MMERFADPLDTASEQEQRTLDHLIQKALDTKKSNLRPVGACYNCDEPLGQGLLFCDHHCRDDYEARMASRRRA